MENSEEIDFKSMFYTTSMAINIYKFKKDKGFVLCFFNPASEKLSSNRYAPKKELTIEEVFPEILGTTIPQMLVSILNGDIESQNIEIHDENNQKKSWYSISAYRIDTNTLGVEIIDISESKKAKLELQSYFDNAPDGVFVANKNGAFIEVNNASSIITGYSRDELLTMTIPQLYANEDLEFAKKSFTELIATGLSKHESQFLHKNGEKRWWSVDAVKLSENNYIGFSKDITERIEEREKERNNHNNVEILSKTAMEFIEFPLDENIFDYVGEKIDEFIGSKSYVVVNSVDQITRKSTVESVIGFSKISNIVRKKLGTNIIGMTFDIDETVIHYDDGRLHEYNDGLYGLFLETVPNIICKSLEKIANIKKIYVIDLAKKAQFFGSVIILLKEDITELKNKHLVEAFIKQASIAILKRKAEEELILNENKLNLIINSSPLGICTVDTLGHIITTNTAYENILGYTKEELIGVSFYDLTHPDDRPLNKKLFEGMFSENSTEFTIEKRYIHKNGNYINTLLHATGIKGFNGNTKFGTAFIEDITKRKEAETSLKEMALFPKLNPAPVMRFNKDGVIVSSNPASDHIIGDSTTPGKHISLILPCFADVDFFNCITNDIMIKKEAEIKDRIYQFVILGISESNIGNIYGVDITDLKLAEKELLESEKRLHQSQKMDAIGQLAGGIAHDFNNSLTGIIGGAELLLERDYDEKSQTTFLNMIINSANRAGELTKKLLLFARKGSHLVTSIDILSIINETVILLEHTINKNISISVVNKSNKTKVIGDEAMLQNTLINLGINSSHALINGGEIVFSLSNIYLDDEYCSLSSFNLTPGEYLQVDIMDSGIGMSPQIQSHIFEPFFTTKDQGKGTGIGLATVYGAIKEHNGSISVNSEEGIGTVFHLYLPLSEEIIDTTSTNTIVKGIGKILVIDDEEIIRITTEAMLVDLGYEVICAENGKIGLELFKLHNDINLVLLDMIMPVMGGRETFDKLRQIDQNLSIIICSGFSKESDLDELYNNGVSGFLDKPFKYSELSELVKSLLNK